MLFPSNDADGSNWLVSPNLELVCRVGGGRIEGFERGSQSVPAGLWPAFLSDRGQLFLSSPRGLAVASDLHSPTRALEEVGLTEARGALMPEDKVAAIKELASHKGGVAMVGVPQGLTHPPTHSADVDTRNAEMHAPARGWMGPTPGTIVLVAVFLLAFIAYYFTNWKLLSFLWKVG